MLSAGTKPVRQHSKGEIAGEAFFIGLKMQYTVNVVTKETIEQKIIKMCNADGCLQSVLVDKLKRRNFDRSSIATIADDLEKFGVLRSERGTYKHGPFIKYFVA